MRQTGREACALAVPMPAGGGPLRRQIRTGIGGDLEAFIEKVNQVPIGPGGTPVFSAHQMCSAKLGRDPQTSVAKPDGELHDTTGVWIADASGMPCCSGVNPMVSVMALARRTAMNMLNNG